jgi:hypothetical protein
MDEKLRTARAKAVLNDEILTHAFDETLARINKELLNSKSPEDRELKWHEHQALNRAWRLLKTWGAGPDN